MDHGRKIGKTTESNTIFKSKLNSPACTVFDLPIVPEKPSKKDNRLANWKKWLRNRQNHYKVYEAATGRHQTQLVMNSCEDIRPFNEMKILMDYANVPVPVIPDKYRGNPGFWKSPELLFNRGNPCLPDVSAFLDKKKLNLLPELEYVDVPKLIRKEKNLVRLQEYIPGWKRSSYLSRRKDELSDTLALLEPCLPDTTDFVVHGHGYTDEEEYDDVAIPVLTVSEETMAEGSEDDLTREESRPTDTAIILKIQDREIVRDERLFDPRKEVPDPISWTLNFETVVDEKTECILCLENKGTMTITYHWRDETFSSNILPLPRKCSNFFFNKNKSLILPGQIIEFPIWFHVSEPGIFSETWSFVLEPKVYPAPLLIGFHGYAAPKDSDAGRWSIERYLDCCIRNAAVREALNDTLYNIGPTKPPEPAYKSVFVEGEIFRAKNPSHFYHASLVAELRKMYDGVVGHSGPGWNLSLTDLRQVLLEIRKPDIRHESLLQFSELCQECLKPCLFNPIGNMKYTLVYNILCTLANNIEEEVERIRISCSIRPPRSANVQVAQVLVSISRTSVASTTPRHSKRSIQDRKSSKARAQSTAQPEVPQQLPVVKETIDNNCLFREMLFVRVYDRLGEAIEQVCAVIDSLNNLNEMEP